MDQQIGRHKGRTAVSTQQRVISLPGVLRVRLLLVLAVREGVVDQRDGVPEVGDRDGAGPGLGGHLLHGGLRRSAKMRRAQRLLESGHLRAQRRGGGEHRGLVGGGAGCGGAEPLARDLAEQGRVLVWDGTRIGMRWRGDV